jgi:hypothetical protein
MSHVATIDLEVKDLKALQAACERLGMEFREGQKTYKWFGGYMGDSPLPEGFAAADLGRCDHALSVKGNAGAYEVGVVRRRDGKPGYTLLWDFWAGGYGLQNVVGQNCANLKEAYTVEFTKNKLRAKGYHQFKEERQDSGKLRLTAY